MGTGLEPDLLERSNLTRGQLAIWTGQQLHPEAPLYNMAFSFTIDGPVDRDLFERALARLVERRDALRTILEMDGDVPVQRVLPHAEHGLDFLDLSTETDPAAAAGALAQERCERPFAPDRRLFDTALYKLSERRYLWYFGQHHLLSDAWSASLLFADVEREYSRLASGASPPGREPDAGPPDFASYVAFERARRREPGAAAHWSRYAATDLSPPRLYGRRPATTSTRSSRLARDLGPDRSRALRALARRPEAGALTADLGLFNLMAALLVAFQHRVSGASRIGLGALSHNRPTAAFRETAGLFTEIFPLAVEVASGDTFLDLLGKARDETQGFLKFAVAGAGDARQNRGFNTVLNLIRGSFGDFDGAPVRSTWMHPGHHDREHHLRLHVHDFDAGGGLHLLFDFNHDVFDQGEREEAVGHFLRLVDALIEDWNRPIREVDLLSTAERERQLATFNRGGATAPPRRSVVESFEAQAALVPEAVAVAFADGTLSYRELDRRADELAQALRTRGLGRGARIGLSMARSPEAVVGLLAVLKAGGAYVPVDPGWPEERTARILDEAGVEAVLTRRDGSGGLAERWRDVEIVVDPRTSPVGSRGGGGPRGASAVDLARPAYVLFTSGSTGRPKGVVVGHAALANYVAWACEHYVGARRLAFPLYSPLTFDLTVTSIFVPLASGGSVVVYPETGRGADLALLDVVADDAVDVIKLTPSHLSLLRDLEPASSRGGPPRTRQLIFGGEALTTSLARRARELFGPAVAIHNEYGPTEATVGCVVHTFDAAADAADAVPIGAPIAGLVAYVLDAGLRPVPEGVSGRLFVGGAGLADGYLDQPGLTAQRFTGDPFARADRAGERIYDTGDLARFRAPGVLEYVGRSDDQVKIRGARIELGEVEAALAAHPEIESCAVTVETRREATPLGGLRHCARCGLASDYPGIAYDAEGVCSHCRAFENYERRVEGYFRSPGELREILDSAARERPEAAYDCLALLSGGKDSTYVLCRLVDMGYRVLAFTLDNGFISDQAKANIARVVEALGVEHVWGSTPAMNEIFVDSLERHANVCHGCFKTIYTLSMGMALERGIPFIVTGLSRGQFFETRLTEELFTDPDLAVEDVDEIVLEARKAYHRVEDAVRRRLDVSMFEDDRVFEQVRFVDFYRYVPVDLDELMEYLDERVPWVRPSDTGRSTNCLINDVGIWVHRRERGFHNYALPYSWDVRMGHKTREAAIAELDDEIDEAEVSRILEQVGYRGDSSPRHGENRLTACYTAARELGTATLREHLGRTLPDFMIPSRFVRLEALPMTVHGKVDRPALATAAGNRQASRESAGGPFVPPRTGLEVAIARAWSDVLRVERVGVRDNFFDLGGDSILAIQIVARCHRAGLKVTPAQLFDTLTVEKLARVCGAAERTAAEEEPAGPVALAPAQRWFFEAVGAEVAHWNHVLWASAPAGLEPRRLERALERVVRAHEALRLRFTLRGDSWGAESVEDVAPPPLTIVELNGLDERARAARLARLEAELDRGFALDDPPLLKVALARSGEGRERILFVAHHLVVDAVSWSILLDDLESAYESLAGGRRPTLPPAGGIGRWTRALAGEARSRAENGESDYWRETLAANVARLPVDLDDQEPDTMAASDLVAASLDAGRSSALLEAVPARGRFRVDELLVTALAETLAGWSGRGEVGLVLESHGREELDEGLDASRTVGWLTSLYPVRLEVAPGATAAEALRGVRERLRGVPSRGLGFGLLRYLEGSEVPQPAPRRFGVLFNYLGRADRATAAGSLFRVERPLALSRGSGARRPFLLEVDAAVFDGRLRVGWSFSRRRHRRETVEALAAAFVDHLERAVEHCLGEEGSTVSAGDFPLANLDEAKLAKLAAVLGRGRGNE